jgi:hypothetical protein
MIGYCSLVPYAEEASDASMGEQPESAVAYRAARDAFIEAGGDPHLASHDVPRIIGAASGLTLTLDSHRTRV